MRSLLTAGLTLIAFNVLASREAMPAANDAAPVITRQTTFAVPFTFDPLSGGAHEIHLYVSGDHGKDWVLYQRQLSSSGRFVFRAGQDGEYWFVVRTVGSAAEPISAGTRPDLRVIVDTTQPKLELTAEASPTGEVDTRWFVGDLNTDPSTMELEYRVSEGEPWQPVNIDLGDLRPGATTHSGKTTWWPKAGERPAAVRAIVRDRARNLTTAVCQLAASAPTGLAGPGVGHENQSPHPAGEETNDPLRVAASIPWPGQRANDAPTAHGPGTRRWQPPAAYADSRQLLASNAPSPAARRSARRSTFDSLSGRSQGVSSRRQGQSGSMPAELVDPFTQRNRREEPSVDTPRTAARMLPASASSNVVQRDAHPRDYPNTTPPSVEPDVLTRGEQPRVCRSRRFQLDYEVEQSSGVALAGVELWYTTDGGRKWGLYGEDDDRTSPFAVQLDHEGTYGFRLVLRGADGMAARPPRSGDPADMWLHADWTAPTAQLTSAQYGSGEQLGNLVIGWEANDDHLADRPVSLYYAKNSDGPWTIIAARLADTGQYAWHLDERVPRDFYLRLEVADLAGNVAEDQLVEPISSDGLAPQGRIRSVRPLNEPDSREAVAHPGTLHSR